ncbi:sensor histidine kinase [Vibrio rhizosphaerae]|uniref:sensor histidine kinase n=1 Tax=Vibrio rhizosphaerae TaxID=398736 RepID=UPI00056DAA61|nr:sensor histidine kinase [Vibrio rhizosphaerae]
MTEKFNEKNDSLTFDVDAQLITELGERLVSRNHIGISELIKNAYDADSPSVNVSLINASDHSLGNSELVISDKGLGMTFKTVETHWMTIGTSNKRSHPLSKLYGRPVTGNKGIGRFACQRLAQYLELSTCAKVVDSYEHTIVQFDWDDFVPGKRLSTVKCRYNTYTSPTGSIGTTLKLRRLRERVTERDFKMILKSITLISIATPTKRNDFKEDPGFEANIYAPEFENLVGSATFKADEKLLSSGWGTVSGCIDDDGVLAFKLDSKGTDTQTYSYTNSKFLPLSGISFTIHIVPLKSRDGIEYRRNPTLLTRSVLKDITDIHSGIKLYLNGFRVYPYGEVNEGDDWLGIAHDISRRRGPSDFVELQDLATHMGIISPNRAMLNHPGTRSLIGNVIIEGNAVDAFQVKMDREGLVANDNFKSLKDAIRMSLDWATINYEAWLIRERKKRHAKVTQEFEESVGNKFESTESRITKAINTLWSQEDTDEEPSVESDDASKTDTASERNKGASPTTATNELQTKPESSSIASTAVGSSGSPSTEGVTSKVISKETKAQKSSAQAYLLSEYKELEAESELLRAVSATAPLLFVFAHEVKGIAQALISQSAQLKLIADKIEDVDIKNELISIAQSADMYKKSFDDLFELFEVFSDSTTKSSKKVTYRSLFNRIQTGFRFFLKQYDIELEFENISPILGVPKLNSAEAYSVLINLISNSIKSLIASDSEKRLIQVSVVKDDSTHYITVKDNGIGLKKEHWQKVFEPRTFDPEGTLYSSVSSKLGDEKLSNLGKGSGLGLNIVQNILKKHKGNVKFVSPSSSWNAEVQVTLGN